MKSMLNYSCLDSNRFGVKVFRGHVTKEHLHSLKHDLMSLCGDVYILRVDAGNSLGIPETCQQLLMPCVHADTLVYYTCDLTCHQPKALRNTDIKFNYATAEDADELHALIRQTFVDYVSHYHANPMFGSEDILNGYIEWAMSHATGTNTHLWLARRAGVLVAFAACKILDSGEMEGVLYGVSPIAANGGVYGDLIRFTQAAACEMGVSRMIVSTQVHNFAVQKVWAREGFHLYKAFDTFHVNAMLSAGEVLIDRELYLSKEQIQQFSIPTESSSFGNQENPFVYSSIFTEALSQISDSDALGSNFAIDNISTKFFQPVIADKKYRLSLHLPRGLCSDSMEVIMKIKDGDQLCTLSRCRIITHR